MTMFVLLGRVKKIDEGETSKGTKFAKMTLICERDFVNSDGFYETDEIDVELWRGLAEYVTQNKNDLLNKIVYVKGRISSLKNSKNGKEYKFYSFVAEKMDEIERKDK